MFLSKHRLHDLNFIWKGLFVFLFITSIYSSSWAKDPIIKDKTLVAWVELADLSLQNGHVLSIQNTKRDIDAVAYGGVKKQRWMAGKRNTKYIFQDQEVWPKETAQPGTMIQIAIVYKDRQTSIYRNGKFYAAYNAETDPLLFDQESVVWLGVMRQKRKGYFNGAIEDARIYDKALDAESIAALQPNVLSKPAPLAWWNFESGLARDRMGRFTDAHLFGNARIADGKLHLDGEASFMLAGEVKSKISYIYYGTTEETRNFRVFREKLLVDPHRPGYHFVIPEGRGAPFDPNGAIFWKGRYHLFYIHLQVRGFCWGHVSSTDLVHWRHHPTSLFPEIGDVDKGMFSGACFINKKGEATMLYHGVGAGNCIATSSDDLLDVWTKLPSNPIVPKTTTKDPYAPGAAPYASWDPHGWREGDTYYAIFGGGRPAIFKADRIDAWAYVGDLMGQAVEGVDIREDVSCPDFFKLGDKYMLLCISHRLGCSYYLGDWKNEQFFPEFYERMSWVDGEYFAPESMLDDKGRRIMWAWVNDGRDKQTQINSGWTGTMGLPRQLWLGEDGMLRMRPVEELENLRYNGRQQSDISIKADSDVLLPDVQGNSLELSLEIFPHNTKQVGLKVCCSPDGKEETVIYYDAIENKIKIDTRKSSLGEGKKTVEAAPFELEKSESLQLRVFIDKSIIEVYANERQALSRRIYPTLPESQNIKLFANGGPAEIKKLKAWDMMPSNPY
jgi:beta-fructofuranosidase